MEAGFDPNEFQGAYPDDVLLERFVALMRELKRYPVAREVKLRATKDKTFPNQKTFSRLGTKAQFAAKIRQYCEGRDGYDDVIAMCEAIPSPPDTRSDGKVSELAFGFVYLLKSGRWYKIGRSNAVGRRERELAIQLPEKADTVHTIRTDDPCGIETYWHQRFQSKRKNGEWFELSAEDVSAFKRRKFM